MRHRIKKNMHFNAKDRDHAKAMIRNLLTSLFLHKAIVTTEKRACAVAAEVDGLINLVNTKDKLTAIRSVMQVLYTRKSSEELLDRVAPKYKEQNLTSGMTRITPIKYREGDGAKLVKLELI